MNQLDLFPILPELSDEAALAAGVLEGMRHYGLFD